MRHSFTLSVGFREDIRGNEQTQISEQIEAFAANQDIQSIILEDESRATFAFMANPTLVDERKDYYEVDALRHSLEHWLSKRQEIVSFKLQQVTTLDAIAPKVSNNQDNNKGLIEGYTPSGTFYKFLRK